ncbi:aminoacylase-1-like isoform X1 [Trichogramma pretiosum]|uniref:aminoacylase-1-like isoform X1 n=2 Tax=Trichogramma pretiosum TaxID=7493 RepID=UPI0006C99E55|nr:aminoacylase-1-like isoform X1 [Trichogramma pretiosum]
MANLAKTQLDELSLNNFCEYLRIPSMHPDINYEPCIQFLRKQAKDLDLSINVYHVHPKKPIAVMSWIGTEPSLPSILLNSHMDVVPVFADDWTYPPFDAHIDDQGNIFARGSQDMKCVGIQYLEAIRRMKLEKKHCKRTIHISFMPEEEVGGVLGMKDFVHTQHYKSLNIGFALDEGVANPSESYSLFNGERTIWHVTIHCPGNPGHGSLLLDNTPGEKLRIILDKMMDFRKTQQDKLLNSKLQLGDVTSINLTKIKGGIQANVIPNKMEATFDIRLDPEIDPINFESTLKNWCKQAGNDVYFTFDEKNEVVKSTKLDDSNNFWKAFKSTCDKLEINLEIGIFPGGTDSRYIRSLGIPAIGFSPMNKTKILLHDHDEHLNKEVFLNGIRIYEKIIYAVANV